jgi:hypothetical protein
MQEVGTLPDRMGWAISAQEAETRPGIFPILARSHAKIATKGRQKTVIRFGMCAGRPIQGG